MVSRIRAAPTGCAPSFEPIEEESWDTGLAPQIDMVLGIAIGDKVETTEW